MGYSERMNELMDQLNKSIESVNKLDYYKKRLLKILDDKEKAEETLSKSIQTYFEDLNKTLYGISIEKGRVGTVGEIRTWKDGKKYKKMPDGKWIRVYQQHSRSAEISIARLKGKVKNAKTVDELLNIVMANIHRFEDENGKVLPIVEELKKEVNTAKGKINSGKPSTKEQIEKYKIEHKKADKPYTEIKVENIKVGDKIHYVGGDFKVLSIEKDPIYTYLQIGEKRTIGVKEGANVKLVNEDYQNEYSERVKNVIAKIEQIKNSDKDIHDKLKEMRELRDSESKYYYDMIHEADKGKNYGDDYFQQERIYLNSQYDYMNDKNLVPAINELYENQPEVLERERKEQEEKDRRKNELRNKLSELNKDYVKSYSEEEIKASKEKAAKLKTDIDPLIEFIKGAKVKESSYRSSLTNIKVEVMKQNGNRKPGEPYINYMDDERYLDILNEKEKFNNEVNQAKAKLNKLEKELDEIIEPVAYDIMNKDYSKDNRIDKCNSTNDVVDLMKSKDWYSDQGKDKINLKGMELEGAKTVFKVLEHVYSMFEEMKGKNVSLDMNNSNSSTWATGSYWSGITFNRKWWKDYKGLSNDYDRCEGGFHPAGTDVKCLVYHEFYHVMTTHNNNADFIKKTVTEKLKTKGKKGGPKQAELIRVGVSEYALKNADEFGAECFCQNFGTTQTGFSRSVFTETVKLIKYFGGINYNDWI